MAKSKHINMSGKDGLRFFKGIVEKDFDSLRDVVGKYAPEMAEKMGGTKTATKRRKVTMPKPGYRPGVDPEHDYFNPPKMARAMKEGGKVTKKSRDGLAQRGKTKGVMR